MAVAPCATKTLIEDNAGSFNAPVARAVCRFTPLNGLKGPVGVRKIWTEIRAGGWEVGNLVRRVVLLFRIH